MNGFGNHVIKTLFLFNIAKLQQWNDTFD